MRSEPVNTVFSGLWEGANAPDPSYTKVLQVNPAFESVSCSIAEHARRYFWKHNNYYSTTVATPEDVLAECLALAQKYTADELRAKIGDAARRVQEAKPIRDVV